MSSRVAFSLTHAQLDYLRALDLNPAAWPTFNPRIGLALATASLVRFSGGKPSLTPTGEAAARLAHLVAKASPVTDTCEPTAGKRRACPAKSFPEGAEAGSAVLSV